jgi:nicotinamide riboside kinase
MNIAILGAECTGKSHLATLLAAQLRSRGQPVTLVNELLREWCTHHGRTPRADEQMGIAHEQARRVEAASAEAVPQSSPITLADTTPLMTAIYSELLFGDTSLYDFAMAHQRRYDLTLVTGLDVPWVADGVQRDGPQVRDAVDTLLRAVLNRAGVSYQVVYGASTARLEKALNAINLIADCAHISRATGQFTSESTANWRWPCDKCSDPECERKLFTQLLQR